MHVLSRNRSGDEEEFMLLLKFSIWKLWALGKMFVDVDMRVKEKGGKRQLASS